MNNIKKLVTLCSIAIIISACTSEKAPAPEVVQVKRIIPYHKVTEGDSIASIATQYGMTRAELISINKLEPPYYLYEGQRLVIIPRAEKEPQESIKELQDENKEDQDDKTIDDIQEKEHENNLQTKSEEKHTDYVWPVEGGRTKITQKFGENNVDGGIIISSSHGTPVKAITDGIVMIAGVPSGEAAAYGKTIVIRHTSKKTMSIYACLADIKVKTGQKVTQGQIIGSVGKSGTIAKDTQLYFEINDLKGPGRKAIDPSSILPNE
ncbi:MAG: M23 family metallopeptidase [Alphaproteobacteria bacterium]|nr:M23 family metallopeptidase [Alphaproteobacteria bacterium]